MKTTNIMKKQVTNIMCQKKPRMNLKIIKFVKFLNWFLIKFMKKTQKKDSFAEKNEKKAPPKKGTNETFNRFDVLQNN